MASTVSIFVSVVTVSSYIFLAAGTLTLTFCLNYYTTIIIEPSEKENMSLRRKLSASLVGGIFLCCFSLCFYLAALTAIFFNF